MGPIGVPEMMVIVVIALILFGPKKLPELGRTLGKAMTEFRRATSDLKSSFEREMHNLDQDVQAEKASSTASATQTTANESQSSYEDPYEDPYYPDDTQAHESGAPAVSEPETPAEEKKAEPAGSEESAEAKPGGAKGVEGTVARSETAPQHS